MTTAFSIFIKFAFVFFISNYLVKIYNLIAHGVYAFSLHAKVPYFEILSDTFGFFGMFMLLNMIGSRRPEKVH
jgi:hypothetical protein